MFHPHWRDEALASLGETFDLVVLGGGITGCGVLFEAAQRGLRVLLVEKGDLASGTSSRSSKLVHGGLRYLKQMQFQITRQACRERDRMLRLNPALVRPIRFLYPTRRGAETPAWTVDLGLWMYDRLTERPEKHTRLTPREAVELVPGLDADDLDRAHAYTDALADDARLTRAVAATAFAYGGRLLTRAEVREPIRGPGGEIAGVVVEDLETGRGHRIAARLVVNAAGVWVDDVRHRLGLDGRRLRPSRGSHLVLAPQRIPLAAAVTTPSPDDRRPVFLIPHPEGVLVGTTDLFHDGPLDDPRSTPAEVAYLLRAVASLFPRARLEESDVVGAFAGLRPILDTDAEDPSKASREEAIWEEEGLLSVAGGKLTTWRSMAQEVVDEARERLPEERSARVAPSASAGTPLVGLAPADQGERLARWWGPRWGISAEVAHAAARRLVGAAPWMPRLARSPSELRPLLPGLDLTAAEVRVHLAYGAVLRLEDLLLRRVRLGLWSPEQARAAVPALRPLCRQELAWDGRRWEREEEAFAAALEAWTPPRSG
jgi:glycerol-3-phosphate dehydrogenase